MKALRLVILLLVVLFVPQAWATDISDLWWNPAEDGWGVNVSHQRDILFVTFFVYGQNGAPVWLVGPATAYQGVSEGGGSIFQGPLYQTTGPWYGGTFNPSAVSVSEVGTVTWTMNTVQSATVAYSVGGVRVTKSVTRQTFRTNLRVEGRYFGGMIRDATGCQSNGHFESASQIGFVLAGSIAQIAVQMDGRTCTFTGTYVQAGRMGRVPGTVSCTSGGSGSATVFEIEANTSGLTARYQADYGSGCTEEGWLGGARR